MKTEKLDERDIEQVSGGVLVTVGIMLGVIGAMEPMYDMYRGFTENRR